MQYCSEVRPDNALIRALQVIGPPPENRTDRPAPPHPPQTSSGCGLARLFPSIFFPSRILNRRDSTGCRPLEYAILSENIDTVAWLLAHGADPNLCFGDEDCTPLQSVIPLCNENLFNALLCAREQLLVDKPNKLGERALHWAARFDKPKYVDTLVVSANADPNVRDNKGDTPLHYAAGLDYPEVIRNLSKSARTNLDIRANGMTPLMVAATCNSARAVRELLELEQHAPGTAGRRHRVDVNAKGDDGSTALHLAASAGFLETVTVLLSCPGLDLDARVDGKTAAQWARDHEHIAVAEEIEAVQRLRGAA